MAHYAFLDQNNIVTNVIVGLDENLGTDWEQVYGDRHGQVCKRTSYNTKNGQHTTGGIPFRKNYAGIGFSYDEERDAFIPPKPFNTWMLNEETCQWFPPTEYPNDGQHYVWSDEDYEETGNGWILHSNINT